MIEEHLPMDRRRPTSYINQSSDHTGYGRSMSDGWNSRSCRSDEEEFSENCSETKSNKKTTFLLCICFLFLAVVVVCLAMNHIQHKVKAASTENESLYIAKNNRLRGEQVGGAPPQVSPTAVVTDKFSQKYTVLATLNRNTRQHTQGLAITEEHLIECTGEYGKSSVQILQINEEEQIIFNRKTLILDAIEYGQGCAILKQPVVPGQVENREILYQTTWKNGILHKYLLPRGIEIANQPLNKLAKITLPEEPKEYFGVASRPGHSDRLLMSDGSSNIYEFDVSAEEPILVKSYAIKDKSGAPLAEELGELEWVEDYLFATVRKTNTVLVINLEQQHVVRTFDFDELFSRAEQIDRRAGNPPFTLEEKYLNGLAYDKQNRYLYVTGRQWPSIFRVQLPQYYLIKPPMI